MSDKKAESAASEAKPTAGDAGQGGGGFKAWLPLMVTIVLMPALAFVTTKFLVLPKVVQARGSAVESAGHGSQDGGSSHEATKDSGDQAKGKAGAKKKQTFPITKVIVNVAGTMGARYLMASFTLVGTQQDFKTVIEENKDQLLDLANTAMASKTITDLEKPGARNQLRAELMTIFNNALGNGIVQEIYFTEFAVQ
jgi:flagellar FliL protein